MALQNSELSVAKSFQDLLNYVSTLGDHINKLYNHLATIEENLLSSKVELEQLILSNKTELFFFLIQHVSNCLCHVLHNHWLHYHASDTCGF